MAAVKTSISSSVQLKVHNFFSLKDQEWYFATPTFMFLNENMKFSAFSFHNPISGIFIYLNVSSETSKDERNVVVDKIGIKATDGSVHTFRCINTVYNWLYAIKLIELSKFRADKEMFGPSGDVIFFMDISDGRVNNTVDNVSEMSSNAPETQIVEKVKFLKTLSNDLGKFYDSKTDSDCVIKCGDSQFPVHRHVLSARSEVFAAMFHHDTSESRTGEVDIPDIEAPILENVLYYIYRGKIRGLGEDTATNMYVAADKYGLLELKEECKIYLENNLTVKNICDVIKLAHMHGEVSLYKTLIRYFDDNLKTVVETENWKKLMSKNPLLANRVIFEAYLESKK